MYSSHRQSHHAHRLLEIHAERDNTDVEVEVGDILRLVVRPSNPAAKVDLFARSAALGDKRRIGSKACAHSRAEAAQTVEELAYTPSEATSTRL